MQVVPLVPWSMARSRGRESIRGGGTARLGWRRGPARDAVGAPRSRPAAGDRAAVDARVRLRPYRAATLRRTLARRGSPHHGNRVEDRVRGRPGGRGGRHARGPRVDEDGDARRGRGRRRREGDQLRGGPVRLRGRHPGHPGVSELASGKLLLDEPAEGGSRLTIRNPAKRNALDHEILDSITETMPNLSARCVVVTGSEGIFSAGYDIGDIPPEEFAVRAESLVAHPFADAIEALESYPYPTVAALNGHAIGGGLEVALACDLRVAALESRLRMPPAKP